MDSNTDDLILGVEREVVEGFFALIKEKYPLVDKANYFLETYAGTSGINIAAANQRDFLSHLCTVLSREDLSKRQKFDQLSQAEEHLRRAIIESYQKAVALKLNNVFKLFDEYKNQVLPIISRHSVLSSAPNLNAIKAIITDIENLRINARSVKNENIWDGRWEDGIRLFLEAFSKSEEIERTLEDYLIRAKSIKTNRNNVYWAFAGIAVTIIIFFIGKAFGF